MEQIPQLLRKFNSQIWFFFVMPIFFFCYILIYHPYEAKDFFDAGNDKYAFNLTMCMCIVFGCTLISRIVFHLIFKNHRISYIGYTLWCIGEVVIMSLFCSLYMWLIYKGSMQYFSVLGKCVEICMLTLVIPYIIITLVMCLINAYDRPTSGDSDKLVRFTDSHHRLRLVIATSSILYIEAEENYVRIHYMESGIEKDYVLRNSMKSIEELINRHGLVRCHRSFFINPTHVKVLRKDKEGVILAELDSEAREVPVSKKYYENISTIL